MRPISCALVIPAANRAEMNAIGEALGYGPDNLSVPLSSSGVDSATHYGCHTWCEQSFIDLLTTPPPEYAASPALANLTAHYVQDGIPTETFNTLLAQMGLQRVEVVL